jgi:hypothetical protein
LYVTEKDFTTYEVFTVYGLPWRWQPYSHSVISTRWNLEGGLIRSEADKELLVTSGPGIAISKNGWPVWLDGGVGLAFLSNDKIGKRDFGAPIQFTGHAGISYNFGWNLVLGYRFYHLSDAGFFEGKGVNRQLIELSYHF